MHIKVEKINNKITAILVSGRIDGKIAPDIQEEILPHIQENSQILLDMSSVDYLSSAGLRMLLILYRQATQHKASLVLVGMGEEIKDIMSITGFLKYFEVYETREEGIKHLEKGTE